MVGTTFMLEVQRIKILCIYRFYEITKSMCIYLPTEAFWYFDYELISVKNFWIWAIYSFVSSFFLETRIFTCEMYITLSVIYATTKKKALSISNRIQTTPVQIHPNVNERWNQYFMLKSDKYISMKLLLIGCRTKEKKMVQYFLASSCFMLMSKTNCFISEHRWLSTKWWSILSCLVLDHNVCALDIQIGLSVWIAERLFSSFASSWLWPVLLQK